MCAAPGSKTAQIIEMVHANEQPKVVPSKAFDDFLSDQKERTIIETFQETEG